MLRMLTVGTLGAMLPAATPNVTSADVTSKFTVREIAPGVFVHQGQHALFAPENAGDVSNCGFVVGSDCVAVIDSGGSPRVGEALLASIRRQTNRPIRYVINTHMHPDHIFGNAAFAGLDIEVVGHPKLKLAEATRAERYLKQNALLLGENAFRGTAILPPTRAEAGPSTLDLGGRVLKLEPWPTAHTDNDLTVTDVATDTLFAGDLIFSGHVPTLDGSIKGWLAVLGQLGDRRWARVVPGHGPHEMAWPQAARPLQNYLEVVLGDVRSQIKAGHSLTEAVASAGQAEKSNWQLFDDYNARNVTAAFAELEWE